MSSDPRPQLSFAFEVAFDKDTDARRRAVEKLQSFIVQAPAGSGKTELLVQRFLALLATVEEPEGVVAITFTRKAAGEMRARVLAALAEASAEAPEQPHKRERWELAKNVLSHSRAKAWNLTENPSRLRILTIDSLCGSVVRLMPWTSELGVPRVITEDAREFYASAAHRTVQLIGQLGAPAEHVRRALEHLDNNVPQLEALIATMLQRRDQWLRHMPKGDTTVLRAQMERTLQRMVCERLEDIREAIPKGARATLVELGRVAAGNLGGRVPPPAIVSCRDLQEWPECSADSLPLWCGIAFLVLKRTGDWRSDRGIHSGIGFPPSHRVEKDRLIDLLAKLRGVPGLAEKIHSVRRLPPGRYTDEQWRILESFAQLLPLAVEQLRAIFTSEQTCDFSEVAQAAQIALGDGKSPTDLALALGHDIQHLLVDEFQDTSISQVELLQTLIAAWKNKESSTVFVVGDPMQSIYRFRQAEVGSFLRVRETGKLGNAEVEPLTLTRNFRSRQSIVDWVNKTFPEVFPEKANVAASAVVFEPCEAAARDREKPSVVRTYAQFGTSTEAAEQEASEIISLIRDMRTRKEKAAILVRSRNHLFSIMPKLREACATDPSLRFQAVEIETLAERMVISDLRALTNALLHLGHRVAWLAILRAPWCGLSLQDLHVICGDGRPGTIWELLQQRLDGLSADGIRRIERVLPVLREALDKRGRLPLRHWIEATWMSLNGPACLQEERDLEDAATYFDLLDELDAGNDLESLAKLEDSVSRLYARPDPEATDHIQVMTIHKAKGLEFDCVILPGLARFTRGRDRGMVAWDERSSSSGPELIMAAMPAKGADQDPIYRFLQGIETEREDNELRRLLYVAVTRAKHELHLFGHIGANAKEFLEEGKVPNTRSFLSLLWPALKAEFIKQAEGQVAASQTVLRLAASADPLARRVVHRLPLEWAPPGLPGSVRWTPPNEPEEVVPDDSVTYDWAGERARRVGTVVHAMLQRIAEEGISNWSEQRIRNTRPALQSALASQGVGPADMQDALARTEQALLAALADDRGRWVLESRAEEQNEYSLTGMDGEQLYTVAMDRTFVERGVRWIVDYKTSVHEGGDPEAFLDNEKIRYKEKMERYARILKKQDPRPVKLGLYFPLMRGWREWEA